MHLPFIDVIEQCADGKVAVKDLEGIDTVAIHRIGKSLGEDAITICRRFIDDPEVAKFTGGEVPYTFIIGETGTLWQCLPVSEIGAHARRWNAQALGVGCIGDFRRHDMPPAQLQQLVKLCAALQYAFPKGLVIKGHDELPGGSSNPKKRCPGDRLKMDEVRLMVRVSTEASAAFLRWGLRYERIRGIDQGRLSYRPRCFTIVKRTPV